MTLCFITFSLLSAAAHKPPLALLMSDGSVYTNSQKGWHIVRGLTKKKNRIIDVSVRGEGSSHRLMAVSTEGLIYVRIHPSADAR